jgi:comEA protein
MGNFFVRTGHRLGLTSNETAVVLFLSATAIMGALLRSFEGHAQGVSEQSYHAHDSTFAARAAALATDTPRESVSDTTHRRRDASSSGHGGKSTPNGRVNINTAGIQELQSLPGVGPSTAARITAYRSTIGPFERIEDIMNVPSIGMKKFEKIKPYLTVSK